ncbi:hypothetical protein DNTS_005867 [Danionella cerebrum]|uniref:Lipase maturation factor n=1 Tax=Danionella cerebrum TaxID=2873325 RepID=A0A553QQR2_9TELE|nr:hypothetical protein DNTS_005867 [Danionella translucida]
MPNPQRPLLEQIQSSPSLLWLAPSLHLEPQQLLEVISLLGVALSLAAVLLARFRDSLLFFCLWALYLSLYTFEEDVLLLEAGFLAVLVAPLGLVCGRSSYRSHDPVSFWLTRWLFFRLTLCSGVSKLATGDPAWYGLSGPW